MRRAPTPVHGPFSRLTRKDKERIEERIARGDWRCQMCEERDRARDKAGSGHVELPARRGG